MLLNRSISSGIITRVSNDGMRVVLCCVSGVWEDGMYVVTEVWEDGVYVATEVWEDDVYVVLC